MIQETTIILKRYVIVQRDNYGRVEYKSYQDEEEAWDFGWVDNINDYRVIFYDSLDSAKYEVDKLNKKYEDYKKRCGDPGHGYNYKVLELTLIPGKEY